MAKVKAEDTCGLCGKTNQQAFIANDKGLTQTRCCSNWICDDEHTYELHSFLENSCYRNHNRYTMCATHYEAKHTGDWKTCRQCKDNHHTLQYEETTTNKHNFEKLTIENKQEMHCRNCGFRSSNMDDFAGSNSEHPGAFCVHLTSFYCKKTACRNKGGFTYLKPGQTFMCNASMFPTENEQRVVSLARSRQSTSNQDNRAKIETINNKNNSSNKATPNNESDNSNNNVDGLLTQAEKMIKKVGIVFFPVNHSFLVDHSHRFYFY